MGQINGKKSIDVSSISVPAIENYRIQYMYSSYRKKFVIGKGTYGYIVIGLLDDEKLVAIKEPRFYRRAFKAVIHREAQVRQVKLKATPNGSKQCRYRWLK